MPPTALHQASTVPPFAARATLHESLARIVDGITKGEGWQRFAHRQFSLGSHFQPILSVADERCVAYEGLLTVNSSNGNGINPQTVFELSRHDGDQLFVDWLCRGLHLRNFANVDRAGEMLFLNAYPDAAIEDSRHPSVFRDLLACYGIDANRVVLEILETGVSDEARLADAVELYRSYGCRIAIDDFGIGHSNFDRLWRLKPDFVKIDRSVNASAVRDVHARRVLVNTINLIHECGAKVVVEGIETRDEALVALEAGTDWVQGYYFARPGLTAIPATECINMFKGLYVDYLARTQWRVDTVETGGLDIFVHAMDLAGMDLRSGMSFNRATEKFRSLPNVQRVFLVTSDLATRSDVEHERMVVDLIDSQSYNTARWTMDRSQSALGPLQSVLDASLAEPGRVHTFAPVDSGVTRQRPLTLSCAFELEGRMVVMVGEIVDRRRPRAHPANSVPSASGGHCVTTVLRKTA
jgi:EAL domain-containing protein (putative c-di-GMP-specific phosphodiesterase class I)